MQEQPASDSGYFWEDEAADDSDSFQNKLKNFDHDDISARDRYFRNGCDFELDALCGCNFSFGSETTSLRDLLLLFESMVVRHESRLRQQRFIDENSLDGREMDYDCQKDSDRNSRQGTLTPRNKRLKVSAQITSSRNRKSEKLDQESLNTDLTKSVICDSSSASSEAESLDEVSSWTDRELSRHGQALIPEALAYCAMLPIGPKKMTVLEMVLDHPEFFQEFSTLDSSLMAFLFNPPHLLTLVNLITRPLWYVSQITHSKSKGQNVPDDQDEKEQAEAESFLLNWSMGKIGADCSIDDLKRLRLGKLPFIAQEILTADVESINQCIFDHPTAFENLLNFLREPSPANPVLSGYVSKVISHLLMQRADLTTRKLRKLNKTWGLDTSFLSSIPESQKILTSCPPESDPLLFHLLTHMNSKSISDLFKIILAPPPRGVCAFKPGQPIAVYILEQLIKDSVISEPDAVGERSESAVIITAHAVGCVSSSCKAEEFLIELITGRSLKILLEGLYSKEEYSSAIISEIFSRCEPLQYGGWHGGLELSPSPSLSDQTLASNVSGSEKSSHPQNDKLEASPQPAAGISSQLTSQTDSPSVRSPPLQFSSPHHQHMIFDESVPVDESYPFYVPGTEDALARLRVHRQSATLVLSRSREPLSPLSSPASLRIHSPNRDRHKSASFNCPSPADGQLVSSHCASQSKDDSFMHETRQKRQDNPGERKNIMKDANGACKTADKENSSPEPRCGGGSFEMPELQLKAHSEEIEHETSFNSAEYSEGALGMDSNKMVDTSFPISTDITSKLVNGKPVPSISDTLLGAMQMQDVIDNRFPRASESCSPVSQQDKNEDSKSETTTEFPFPTLTETDEQITRIETDPSPAIVIEHSNAALEMSDNSSKVDDKTESELDNLKAVVLSTDLLSQRDLEDEVNISVTATDDAVEDVTASSCSMKMSTSEETEDITVVAFSRPPSPSEYYNLSGDAMLAEERLWPADCVEENTNSCEDNANDNEINLTQEDSDDDWIRFSDETDVTANTIRRSTAPEKFECFGQAKAGQDENPSGNNNNNNNGDTSNEGSCPGQTNLDTSLPCWPEPEDVYTGNLNSLESVLCAESRAQLQEFMNNLVKDHLPSMLKAVLLPEVAKVLAYRMKRRRKVVRSLFIKQQPAGNGQETATQSARKGSDVPSSKDEMAANEDRETESNDQQTDPDRDQEDMKCPKSEIEKETSEEQIDQDGLLSEIDLIVQLKNIPEDEQKDSEGCLHSSVTENTTDDAMTSKGSSNMSALKGPSEMDAKIISLKGDDDLERANSAHSSTLMIPGANQGASPTHSKQAESGSCEFTPVTARNVPNDPGSLTAPSSGGALGEFTMVELAQGTRPKVGSWCLSILGLILAVVRVRSTHMNECAEVFLPALVNMLFVFKWNTILHNTIKAIFASLIDNAENCPSPVRILLEKTEFLNETTRIIRRMRRFRLEPDPDQRRELRTRYQFGYAGHLMSISGVLLAKAAVLPWLETILCRHPDWEKIVVPELDAYISIVNEPLGGHPPIKPVAVFESVVAGPGNMPETSFWISGDKDGAIGNDEDAGANREGKENEEFEMTSAVEMITDDDDYLNSDFDNYSSATDLSSVDFD